ncbi:MAG: CoA transferase [Eggerthella lenta]
MESSKGGTWEKWPYRRGAVGANPALVILHISGFGNWGDPDYVRKASFDPIGQAFSGYSNLNGFPDSPPSDEALHRATSGDRSHGCLATLAAVIRARETGEGESIDCCQFEALVRPAGRHAVRRHQPRHPAHAHRQRRPRARAPARRSARTATPGGRAAPL